jgi:hypothetical protein
VQPARYVLAAATVALAIGVLVTPAAALAQEEEAQGEDYDLSFTLPSYGKSGCMVCHGDRNLVRVKGNEAVSYWIDEAVLEDSAHAGILCTGCHVDFSYAAPHDEAGDQWRQTAKLACKNCHEDEYTEYSLSVHSISNTPDEDGEEDGGAYKPLCGDCHGDHDIQMLTDNPDAQIDMHRNGREICGVCHNDYWESYDDYYHGAAYKRGALDAPACWDCHAAHTALPSDDRRSTAHQAALPETCGQCHKEVDEGYLSYVPLIHGRRDVVSENPIYSWLLDVRDSVSGLLTGIVAPMTAWSN